MKNCMGKPIFRRSGNKKTPGIRWCRAFFYGIRAFFGRPHPNPRWTELGRKWYALHVFQSCDDEYRSADKDLSEQVGNPELRERPRREVDKLNKQKKGLA